MITEVSPYRLELARAMGVDLALDVSRESIASAQTRLGMVEGFDVALEMSGHPVRAAGHPREPQPRRPDRAAGAAEPADRDRLGQGDHAHDHDQGHLRPGDVRDLVRDERDAALRPRHLGR